MTKDVEAYLRITDSIGAQADNIGVRFRMSSELNLGQMRIYEAPWQHRYRRTASVDAGQEYSQPFEESDVPVSVDSTGADSDLKAMPFPGREAWKFKSEAEFVQYEDEFYTLDATGGKPLPRGDDVDETYDLGKVPDIVASVFEGRYPVNA